MARNKHIQRFNKARIDATEDRTKYFPLSKKEWNDKSYTTYSQMRIAPKFDYDKQEMIQKLLDPWNQKRINAKPQRPSLQTIHYNQFRLSYCIGFGLYLDNQGGERGRTISRDDSPCNNRSHRAGSVDHLPSRKCYQEKKRRSLSSASKPREIKKCDIVENKYDNKFISHPTSIVEKLEKCLNRKRELGFLYKFTIKKMVPLTIRNKTQNIPEIENDKDGPIAT